MNEAKMENLTDESEQRAKIVELETDNFELQEEVSALTVAQNQKCADCHLVKELSKKNSELMAKLSVCSSERKRYLELNAEAAEMIKSLHNATDQQLQEITRLNKTMAKYEALRSHPTESSV